MCLYRWSSSHLSPFYSPHPKPPIPTCGPPRLLGGFKGLFPINISSAVVFTLFGVIFYVKTVKIERELSLTFTKFSLHKLINKDNLTNLSLTTSNFIRVYDAETVKFGFKIPVCGCTRPGLKSYTPPRPHS